MSAAILVSQTWQPTVLQLMPFSSNNASATTQRTGSSGRTRDFPTLAVTRSRDDWVAHLQASSTVQRATSERVPRSHYNQLYGKQTYSKRAQSEYKPRERHKPESTLEKTCSVNDLNNKIIYTASQERESPSLLYNGSVSLSEIHGAHKPLQNPTSQRAWDGHYYLPQNGFWRAMTLTPGELDLQKHRDVMNKEQAKKTKKLKLNINQLPRSNTPINDNDPDKLNMHQVIQFLRTHNDGKDDSKEKHVEKTKVEKDKEYFLKKRGCASASVEIPNRQRKCVQTKPTDVSTSASRDAINASTRSSPLLRGRLNKQFRDELNESRPAWESDSSGSNKPFRLHRFLKMTPTCAESNHTLNRSYTHVPSDILKTVEINNQINLPKTMHDMYRFDQTLAQQKSMPTSPVDRHCRLAYRLPAKRPSAKPVYRNEMSRSAVGSAKSSDHNSHVGIDGTVIRLPSMYDFKTDSDNDSDGGDSKHMHAQKECGLVRHDNQSRGKQAIQTTNDHKQSNGSATIQTHHNQSSGSITTTGHDHKHSSSLTTHNDIQSSGSSTVQTRPENQHGKCINVQTNKVTVESSKPPTDSTFQCQTDVKSSPKKLHVSVPHQALVEDVNLPKPADCVKLSLRQERGITREKSYMTDLGKSKCEIAEQRQNPHSPISKSSVSISVENKMEKEEDDLSSRTS